MKSVCFVLMPFGVKPDASGRAIDFGSSIRIFSNRRSNMPAFSPSAPTKSSRTVSSTN